MGKNKIKTMTPIYPKIYAYTTPKINDHKGLVKIGYTEKSVEKRINEQTHTVDVEYKIEWTEEAKFSDGEPFMDHDFHRYLMANGIKKRDNTEWFCIAPDEAKTKLIEFKSNYGILPTGEAVPYELRNEQKEAVDKTVAAYHANPKNGEFLWNAKPRFGKTLAAYDFLKKVDAKNVLILTNRPAVEYSWYEDYVKFLGTKSGYRFVSGYSAPAGQIHAFSQSQDSTVPKNADQQRCIRFESLQNLKGSEHANGKYKKLDEVFEQEWDLIILDEAHEATETDKTRDAIKELKSCFKLYLSGTPFKALATHRFPEKDIFNWTYADEQKAKEDWEQDKDKAGQANPYASLPQMNLYSYRLSDIVESTESSTENDKDQPGEYISNLNKFFKAEKGKFVHEKAVNQFLDALTEQEKFPFSSDELRNELKHTLWYLDRIESAKALEAKLKKHPVFKDYRVVLIAGDGKSLESKGTKSQEDKEADAFKKVRKAIENNDKTITLTVGKLTTGTTIPEWSAVLMLSNVSSATTYIQTAFRAQTPYAFEKDGKSFRKEAAYVFDFDPARTISIYTDFASGLSANSTGFHRARNKGKDIEQLLKYMPVFGEDSNGEMVKLKANQVLSISRDIRSRDVIDHGFMSSFLFQNTEAFGSASSTVQDVINKLKPVKPKSGKGESIERGLDTIDPEPDDPKISKGKGAPKTGTGSEAESEIDLSRVMEFFEKESETEELEEAVEFKKSERASELSNILINIAYNDFIKVKPDMKLTEDERMILAGNLENIAAKDVEEVTETNYKENCPNIIEKLKKQAEKMIPKIILARTKSDDKEKDDKLSALRNHLYGLSKAIPSFLMAYKPDVEHKDQTITLENFDTIVSPDVFEEVTGISLDEFRLLRDGYDKVNPDTGETEHIDSNVFDWDTFNAAVTNFMEKKKRCANYLDAYDPENDIFQYVPALQPNQIYTPKRVVKKMVDELEKQDPECFNDATRTFIDPYMKSGLYPAEIVRRLYYSERMKEQIPDDTERLKHIFEKQVYGVAPTKLYYQVATSYILGFDKENIIAKHNFKIADTLEWAQNGELEEKLDKLYPEVDQNPSTR